MSAIETIGRKWAPIKAAERARAERRAHAVHFYTGRNGSAKSMCAVFDTLPDLDAGTPVLSTIRLVDWRNPRPCDDDGCMSARHGKPGHLAAHPAWVPWAQSHGGGGWPQFLDFRDGIILADEVTGIADAHEWASIPVQVTNQWAQLRRRNVVMRMTGLDFINLHKRLRQATNAVTRCRSFLPLVIQGDDGEDLMWRQRRLSAWTTYDAQTLPRDEPSESAWESAQVLSRSRFWIPGSDAAMAYDTAHGALKGLSDTQKSTLMEMSQWLDWLDEMAALEGVWEDVRRDHDKAMGKGKDKADEMTEYARQAARNLTAALR